MRIPLCLLAAVLLLASCENPAGSAPTETSFTFDYRMGTDAWQSFSARGQQQPLTPLNARGHWVFTGGAPPTLYVQPLQPTSSGGWASLLVYVPHTASIDSIHLGTVVAGSSCTGQRNPCTQAIFRVESAAGSVVETCIIVNGMMHITRRTSQWVSGELSGVGTCAAAAGGTRVFVLEDGEFDVALPAPQAAPG